MRSSAAVTAATPGGYDAAVTIELARRLLSAGAPRAAVENALLAEARERVPFVRALFDQALELRPLLERELERAEVPEIHWVRPLPELLARLPEGLCQRLLAVPVHQDVDAESVDVAAIDASSPHIAAEFAYHLQLGVRVLRAAPGQLFAALAALGNEGSLPAAKARDKRPSTRPPVRDSRPPPRFPSDPPIPLVRRPASSARSPADDAEPVLNLSRSKAFTPERAFAFEASLEDAALSISAAGSAEAVAKALCEGLEPAVALTVVVRSGLLEVRATSRALAPEALKTFSVPVGKNTVFDIAVRAGFYLGPLPASLVHAELRAALPAPAADEVYAAPVLVAGRPVLVLLMACFGPSLDATRRADRLVLAAANAIERLVLQKKRGGAG